jgi:hypothetical protein
VFKCDGNSEISMSLFTVQTKPKCDMVSKMKQEFWHDANCVRKPLPYLLSVIINFPVAKVHVLDTLRERLLWYIGPL